MTLRETGRHIFIETAQLLQDHGFRPIRAAFHRVSMLYENTRR